MSSSAADLEVGSHHIRRELALGDAEAIAELHRRVYQQEFGRNDAFVSGVRSGIDTAIAGGWPRRSGGVWLVQVDGALRGSLALTVEDGGQGRVRWFVLEGSLRGRGLGRSLMAELLDLARASRLPSLELETFSALTTAARIYRAAGFELVSERAREDWGTPIVYQRYELAGEALRTSLASSLRELGDG